MNDFPQFMKNPKNAIDASSQSTGVEGYVYDGADNSQMAFWTCVVDGTSEEHVHTFDEYFVVLQGEYTLIIDNKRITIKAGEEYFIPKGLLHAGEFKAGTRTIHAFAGKKAKKVSGRISGS